MRQLRFDLTCVPQVSNFRAHRFGRRAIHAAKEYDPVSELQMIRT
jgi:hypothetical protein